jgi:hypothetical protein
LKITQDKKKIYANKNKMARKFKKREHVLLKVNPKKSSLKLGSYTKLASIFFGPFGIWDRIGLISYMLALSNSMNVHNVFHDPFMKKYVHDPDHVIAWNLIQLEPEGYFQV